jgi:hypothetical protein
LSLPTVLISRRSPTCPFRFFDGTFASDYDL